jgi:hypothetical protein
MSPLPCSDSNAFAAVAAIGKRRYRILCRRIELFDWRAAVQVG